MIIGKVEPSAFVKVIVFKFTDAVNNNEPVLVGSNILEVGIFNICPVVLL